MGRWRSSRDFFFTALSLVEANREMDKMLKGGVTVKFPDKENGGQRVVLIDWEGAGEVC